MEPVLLDTLPAEDVAATERLYGLSFPPSERRPFGQLLAKDAPMRLTGIYLPHGQYAGFLTLWKFDKFDYVEHFAVLPSLRGSGIGAHALRQLTQRTPRPLVVEVERPGDGNPMAARRIEFYKRVGFHILDYDYIQPPYGPGLPSVPLLLMSTGAQMNPSAVAATLHGKVYGIRTELG